MKTALTSHGTFLPSKGEDWLVRQRVAGKTVAHCLSILSSLTKEKTKLTLRELSVLAEDVIREEKCTPTFKGYKGFPEAVCISVNKELVHGIPNDRFLQEGDIVTFDLGATFEGAIADAATTVIYGEPLQSWHAEMLAVGKGALEAGIGAVKLGNRIGAIGNAIHKFVSKSNYRVNNNYGGHSLSWNEPHSHIFVPNKSDPSEGAIIYPGLTIAIEPLVLPRTASENTYVSKDGWTVMAHDLCCHFEHTLYVHNDGSVEVMTA